MAEILFNMTSTSMMAPNHSEVYDVTSDANVTEQGGKWGDMPSCDTAWYDYSRTILGTTMIVFGVAGNIVTIAVLSHRKMRNPTARFLLALAVFDIVVLSAILVELLSAFGNGLFNMVAVPFSTCLYRTGMTGSVTMTILIAVERYVGIARPFRRMIFFTDSFSLGVILGVVCWTVLFNVPFYMEFYLESYFEPSINATWVQPMVSSFGASSFYANYKFYVQLLVLDVLPWCLMLVLNFLLVQALRRRRRMDGVKNWSRSNDSDTRMSLPILAVTTVFFLAYPLPAITDLLYPHGPECSRDVMALILASELLKIFNSAVNFLLYCLIGRNFRQVMRMRFCPKHARKRKNKYMMTSMHSSVYRSQRTTLISSTAPDCMS